MATQVSDRYREVRGRVDAACRRAGRRPEDVRLVAVGKGMPAEVLRDAASAGARDFGENYVQEWQRKRTLLADVAGVTWHFIGRIQRNKAGAIAEFGVVHTVADEGAARALDAAGERRGAPARVLIQINVADEASKAGIAPAELPRLLVVARSLPWLRVEGLMTIPPALPADAVRPFFAAIRALRDRQERAQELAQLSMGMSADFEVAIEEGATLVRVGTAIFGPRQEAA